MPNLIHDDKTPHLGLLLPHPGNDLGDDVLRVRSTLLDIDNKFAALDLLLQSDDVDLDQLQELVNAIKTNAGDVLALLATKADRAELTAGLDGKASHAQVSAAVSMASAQASAAAPSYDAQGRMHQLSETVAGQPRQSTYTYNADGSLSTVVTTFAGTTRTETYSYIGGRFSGMAATEV